MDADERLRRLLNEAAPPARDFAFQAAVMQRVARRRFLFSLLALLPWVVASALLLWIVGARLGDVSGAAPSLAGGAAAALVLVWAARALARADLSRAALLPARLLTPRR